MERPVELGPLQVILRETTAALNADDDHAAYAAVVKDTPPSDIGAENIGRSGELTAHCVREVSEEAAKRALALAESGMAEAALLKVDCERFAEAVREAGEEMARRIESFFERRKTAAAGLSSLRAVVQDEMGTEQ